MKNKLLALIGATATILAPLAAPLAAQDRKAPAPKLKVAATLPYLGEIVRAVGGDEVDVASSSPIGARVVVTLEGAVAGTEVWVVHAAVSSSPTTTTCRRV